MSTSMKALVFLALCASQILASSIQQELEEEELKETRQWKAGAPGLPSIPNANNECKRDLLLIVDCSYSITKTRFDNDVKPFLKGLISSDALNVSPGGTHIAMITFSSSDNTELKFTFDEKTEQEELLDYIDGLRWESVNGRRTRTELALEIANKQVFTHQSPKNHRPEIPDVIVLLTDGLPKGKYDTEENTVKYAGYLKNNKDIEIIAAAITSEEQDDETKDGIAKLLTKVASPNNVLKAKFDNMDSIIDAMVSKSCIKPGLCVCADTHLVDIRVPPGETDAVVSWEIPRYRCSRNARDEIRTVVPNVSPGSKFGVGSYTVRYIYQLNSGNTDVECLVSFNVKAEMCRGISYNSQKQECCCGFIHDKKENHGCCGPDYYPTSDQICCRDENLVDIPGSCPN